MSFQKQDQDPARADYRPPLAGCPFHSAVFPQHDLERKRARFDGVQKMDLTLMEAHDWFRLDADYVRLMHEKDRLFDSRLRDVYHATNCSLPGAQELLLMISEWLCEYHPLEFRKNGDTMYNTHLNKELQLTSHDSPLLTAAKLVAEDIVLLSRDKRDVYRMSAACVCFPSGWSISEKMGQTVREIHESVTNLNRHIGQTIDDLLESLKPSRPVARINFLINFDPELSQIPEVRPSAAFHRPVITPETIGSVLWLRNERETMRKLAVSDDIVFTLKTYQTRLADVPVSTIKILLDLHEHLDAGYRDMYRKLSPEEHALLIDYFAKRIASAQMG